MAREYRIQYYTAERIYATVSGFTTRYPILRYADRIVVGIRLLLDVSDLNTVPVLENFYQTEQETKHRVHCEMNFKHVCFVFIIQTEFFIWDVDRHGVYTGRAIISNIQLHKLYIVTYKGAKTWILIGVLPVV